MPKLSRLDENPQRNNRLKVPANRNSNISNVCSHGNGCGNGRGNGCNHDRGKGHCNDCGKGRSKGHGNGRGTVAMAMAKAVAKAVAIAVVMAVVMAHHSDHYCILNFVTTQLHQFSIKSSVSNIITITLTSSFISS